jgi:hypothetical protein
MSQLGQKHAKWFIIAILLVTSFSFYKGERAHAAPNVSKIGDTVVTSNGLTDASFTGYLNGESFQQDGIVTFNNWQYTAFWSSDRHVNIARRELPSGSWQTIELTDYTNTVNDSHNTISIGISGQDGTIHLAFDHHGDTLRYRKSVAGLATNPGNHAWNASKFGAVTNQLTGTAINDVTYPRFLTAPDGRLQFFFRTGTSGDGDTPMYEYNNGTWSSLGLFIQSRTASPNLCPYYFGFNYDSNGRLHVSWTWRDTPNASTNFNIMYVYSDDNGRTWRNNAGAVIGTTGSNPVKPGTAGIVVWTIGQNRGLINQESQTVDQLGRVHIVASHMPDSEGADSNFTNARNKAYVFHYWRDTNGVWSRSQVPHMPGVSRSDIGVDSNNNIYLVMPSSLDGATRIATANAAANWTDWRIVHSEPRARFASEPLIDHARLKSQGILSFVQPEIGNSRIAVLDFNVGASQYPNYTGNMAIGAAASASSSSLPAANANDGAALSRWNAGTGTSGNQWLELNLGTAKKVSKVVLSEAIQRITSYNLQYYNGASWINLDTGTALGNKTITFAEVTTSRVRLLINSTSGSSATIYEFEIYGAGGPTEQASWKSHNYPSRLIANDNGTARIVENAAPASSEWIMVPGLADPGGVSFQLKSNPAIYLRHAGYVLYAQTNNGGTFAGDATFYKVPGLADSSKFSFQSYNYPARYIRHAGFNLRIDPIGTALERNDATFSQ